MTRVNGILAIDKPAGVTSHDVVNAVRRILHERRVGHTGTLDPFATGLLVVLVGRATRLAQFLSGHEKEYEAVIRLGYATDTGDVTGSPVTAAQGGSEQLGHVTREEIEAAMASLRGEIDQIPPMYSAKKLGGRKLYELARRGEEVERAPVRVTVHSFETSANSGGVLKDNSDGTFDLRVRVSCSAGTYVRTLAEDFGKRLGVGAHLAELRRTRAGDFHLNQAVTLEQLKTNVAEDSVGKILIPMDAALSRLPFEVLTLEDVRRIQNGLQVKATRTDWEDGQRVRLRDDNGELVAVAEFAAGSLRPVVVITREEA
jgi:tRNA pseudouridine55 synthase